jgi:ArsR family transcriptional regulator, arsenate/arsenite/antimonite-responsive transcriptional repressor
MLKPSDLCDDTDLSPPFEAQARLFWLLGDKTRLQIIHLLSEQPGQLCVHELAEKLGSLEQPTVSHHLKLLYYGGLLYREEKGLNKYYRIQPHTLDKIRQLLDQIGQ